jgi:hypothetical protein
MIKLCNTKLIRKLSQWQDDDFELILKEIDKLFLKMRWLNDN